MQRQTSARQQVFQPFRCSEPLRHQDRLQNSTLLHPTASLQGPVYRGTPRRRRGANKTPRNTAFYPGGCSTSSFSSPFSFLHLFISYASQALLQKVANIDLLLSIATLVPDDPQKCSYRQLNYILLLNTLIDLIAPLKEVLSKSTHRFFVRLTKTLGGEEFSAIKDIVRNTVQENAHPAKGQAAVMQRCFAIKPGLNGLLDLVRKTYSERLDDMRGRGIITSCSFTFFRSFRVFLIQNYQFFFREKSCFEIRYYIFQISRRTNGHSIPTKI